MAAGAISDEHIPEGAEVVRGAEACYRRAMELLAELGFPQGVTPLKELEEWGLVRATGFLWMRQRTPYEHFFPGTGTRKVWYGTEVTAYVERHRMRRMTGLRSRQALLWVPIVEMRIHDPDAGLIYFRTPLGIGRHFPIAAFQSEEENRRPLPAGDDQESKPETVMGIGPERRRLLESP